MRHHQAPQPERLLALDIETVPDRERLPPGRGDKFPKPIHHQIVCISFVETEIAIDDDGCERTTVTACRSGGEVGWPEAEVLRAFWSYFSKRPTWVVGWNTRGFDMPVILQRSFVHGVSAAAWFRSIPRMEACLCVPADAEKWVMVAGQPIDLPGDKPSMLFTFADLEDRRKAEAALQQSQEWLAKSFQLVPVRSSLPRSVAGA